MSDDVCYADATEMAERIRARTISPVELVGTLLERIDRLNPGLSAVVTVAEGVTERAREAEAAVMRGELWGPLHGVPFTIKDVFDTEGVRTTRGSRLYAERVPAADATAVRRLKQAGGILLGKTNLPEFALWSESSNLVFGRTENPWMRGRTPGGSSGGEGAAIAAGMSPLGVGSDLGGSNRLPAHYCGIVGLKPTHGRVPLTGHWPELLLRYMHVGPLARTVRDAALALSVMNGPDGIDPYAVPAPGPWLSGPSSPLSGLRVGWFAEGPFAPISSEVQEVVNRAASALDEMGCIVEPVSLSGWERRRPVDIAGVLLAGEAVHYLEPFVAGRRDELSESIRGLLDRRPPTLKEYMEAITGCETLRVDMARYFTEHDLLLCPTVPVLAHPHDAEWFDVDGRQTDSGHAATATVAFGLTGSPAVSVPFGWSREGLPIGVQLVARHFDEETLMRTASALEARHRQDLRRPPV